jgi:hypothetical protein
MPIARTTVALVFLLILGLTKLDTASPLRANTNVERIKPILNELLRQLRMAQQIRITIAAANERMVSVEQINGTFIICFDEHFLASLDQQELRAAIAHELGHVWIFSHHPYLHTEPLANEIAMRVVSRESLMKIYTKLVAHLGPNGNPEALLGK